eukprot:767903-Hanusia_phi.AAC.7
MRKCGQGSWGNAAGGGAGGGGSTSGAAGSGKREEKNSEDGKGDEELMDVPEQAACSRSQGAFLDSDRPWMAYRTFAGGRATCKDNTSECEVEHDTLPWSEDGQSPLFFAAIKGQLKMVQMLLTAGANVDMKNYDGRTPLSLAAGAKRGIFLLPDR